MSCLWGWRPLKHKENMMHHILFGSRLRHHRTHSASPNGWTRT
ncbi:hypothetical protein PCLA_01r0187 [Pseudomonas citronellolis]|nr:hypothetical protein PCLA_01r0187 [Pseudomonas citronellolis]